MSSNPVPRRGDHETYDELAVGWALHALEPDDEALFARHLPDCTRCARTIAETAEVMAALANDLPPAEPSEELRARLHKAVEETEQVQRPALPADQPEAGAADRPEEPTADRDRPVPAPDVPAEAWFLSGSRPGWRSRVPQAVLAAAVALVLGLGVWDISLLSSRQQAQSVAAEQAQILDALMAPGQATVAPVSDRDGHAVATVVARHGQAAVVTWGLGVNNRTATTYVLWGMQQGNPVALGTFDVVNGRMDMRSVGTDRTGLNDYTGYAISIEPGRSAPAKPSDIVANGQVSS